MSPILRVVIANLTNESECIGNWLDRPATKSDLEAFLDQELSYKFPVNPIEPLYDKILMMSFRRRIKC